VVGPTSPTVAFKIGAKAADPVQMYLNDIYTIPANHRRDCRDVDPVRIRSRRPSGGFATSSAIILPKQRCSTSRTSIRRRLTGTSGRPLESTYELGNRHRSGDTRATLDCRRRCSPGVDRVRRAANTQANAVDIALPGVLPVATKARSSARSGSGLAVGGVESCACVSRPNDDFPIHR